jgi:hypothetical protein
MGLSSFLLGEAPSTSKLATGTKEQMKFGGKDIFALLKQMLQPGGGYNQAQQYHQGILGGGQGDQGAYQNFASPYLQQFQEQILPGIAERFAGQGALSSSGFGQALGGAATGLQSQLAQLFSSLQQQSAGQQYGQFNNMAGMGLGYQPFAYMQNPGSEGLIPGALKSFASGFGQAFGGG